MNLEIELAIVAFSGAAALTSLCVLFTMLGTINPYPVSYTHLTLPTICSV